ncbi:hypothetical protein J7L85_00545 [candidate division WOR-3 bacterium]|nr:hypothetical protein [candidate division WOR-3 bacterium]
MNVKEELEKIKNSPLGKVKEAYWRRKENRRETDMITDVMFRIEALLDQTSIPLKDRITIIDFILLPLIMNIKSNE